MSPLLALLPILALRPAAALEWRTMAGGEFNADSHGVVDLGLRSGAWSAQLLTDTLDLRFAPEGDRGRAWLALRGEAGAAGLMISPWENGAPAPNLAMGAFYVGPEAGVVRYLPRGLYAGAQAHLRLWHFAPLAATTVPVPDDQLRALTQLFVGWWTPSAHATLQGGADLAPGSVAPLQPHLHARLSLRPEGWHLAPRLALSGGLAQGQDRVSLSRSGGLNPYVIPLAGAAWAEWWVEDYAAARLGPSLDVGPWRVEALTDLLWAQGPGLPDVRAVGFAWRNHIQPNRLYVDLDLGWAPWIPRQDGPALSAWAVVGVDWGRGGLNGPPGP